jgi:N-dimethylarginine dimethylaminohydrolase
MALAPMSEVAALERCLLVHPRDAWRDQPFVDEGWRALGFTARPDFGRACDEYEAFLSLLAEAPGLECVFVPCGEGLTLDAVYARDASVCTPRGAVLCAMGKGARRSEPEVQRSVLETAGVTVAGAVGADGRMEGGDVVWLDSRTVAVGIGYRTNAEGCRQLAALLGDGIEVLEVHLPHWRGPGDVFHLMSVLSPIDDDLALVYSPLMSATFRMELLERGFDLVEVPDEELEMGPNALAIAPRRCILEGANVRTRRRLEAAGVEVLVYEGREISRKGMGGPTCLTRPLERSPRT